MKPEEKKPAKAGKPGSKPDQIIINPPEKRNDFNERFEHAVRSHMISEKSRVAINIKSERFGIPVDVLEQVFVRQMLEDNNEQHAFNRLNSFVSFGQAFVDDHDLVPLDEKRYQKGTGGAARPHIKREINPYNGRPTFHVMDSQGRVVTSTNSEGDAKQHLAKNYASLQR